MSINDKLLTLLIIIYGFINVNTYRAYYFNGNVLM